MVAFVPLLAVATGVTACAGTPGDDDPATLGTSRSAESEPVSLPSAVAASRARETSETSSDDAGSPYFACESASSCVAVRLVSDDCCYNGWKVAVASDEVEAYLQATSCEPLKGHLCPEYLLQDRRVPTCDMSAHQCAMVEPDEDGGPPPAL